MYIREVNAAIMGICPECGGQPEHHHGRIKIVHVNGCSIEIRLWERYPSLMQKIQKELASVT